MMIEKALFLLLLLCSKDMVSSVRLVELRVPTHEREGGSALLGCQYDMEGDTLYAIKWYKDGNEFYRYAPKNTPSTIQFRNPGVYVDEARSSGTVVVLANLTRDSAGTYSCEVSGEAPSFATVQSSKHITIHLVPDTGPRVTGLQKQYYVDDLVFANCTSAPSRPETHLKWLINDKPVSRQFIRGPWYRTSTTRPDAIETILQMRFTVSPADFVDGAMRLQCQATIAPLYQRETNSIHYVAMPFAAETPSPIYSAENGDNYAVKVKLSISSLLLPIFWLIVVI